MCLRLELDPKLTTVVTGSPYPSGARPDFHAPSLNPNACQAVPWSLPLSRNRHVGPAATSVIVDAGAVVVVTGGTVVVVVVVGGGDESRRNGPVMRSCSTPRRTRSLTCPTGKRLRCTVLRKSLSVCGVQPVGFQAWLSVDEIMHAVATAVVVIDLDADADLPKVLAIGADQSGRWLEVIWLRFSDRDVVIHAMNLRKVFHEFLERGD